MIIWHRCFRDEVIKNESGIVTLPIETTIEIYIDNIVFSYKGFNGSSDFVARINSLPTESLLNHIKLGNQFDLIDVVSLVEEFDDGYTQYGYSKNINFKCVSISITDDKGEMPSL